MITASEIFQFLAVTENWSVERRELASVSFGNLRRHLRFMFMRLRSADDQESREISERLRMHISEWLTVPICFDHNIVDALETLGEPAAIHERWGSEIGRAFAGALVAAKEVSQTENPVRIELRSIITSLREQNVLFKIWCHRRARVHFESVLEPPGGALDDTAFIHSLANYKGVRPFDTLIKVGPLRSFGWSSAPDALITAPRFSKLIQIVWSGCSDEQNFGYDPVATVVSAGKQSGVQQNRISWSSRTIHLGQHSRAENEGIDEDEFELFRQSKPSDEHRQATLIQIDDEHGILYPNHAKVLTFDPIPAAPEPIALRSLGADVVEGMFCILPRLGDVDLGELQAGEGQFSRKWKERLRHELATNPDGIHRLLRNAGIKLVHLRSRMANWTKPPTTVIHAPQNRSDFEILINVLGIAFDPGDPRAHKGIPWWQYAWREIQRARGEAIQMGLKEHEIIHEELQGFLKGLLPEIRSNAARADTFQLPIIAGRDVYGDFLFFKIVTIEDGYLAPDSELKCVREFSVIEQWRV